MSMQPLKNNWKLAVLCLTVLTLSLFYLNKTASKTSALPADFHASIGPLRDVLIAKGVVSDDHQISIRAQAASKVSTIMVREGQDVKSGQPLIKLADPATEIELRSKHIELQSLRSKQTSLSKEYAGLEHLFGVGGIAANELRQKKLELELADNELQRAHLDNERLQQRREQLILYSPINGVVSGINVALAQSVAAAEELLTLAGGGEKTIVAYVDALDVKRLSIGTPVSLSEQEDGGTVRHGSVRSIARFAGSAQHPNTVKIVIEAGEALRQLRSAQQLYVEFILYEERAALRIPRELVYQKDGRDMVYVRTAEGVQSKIIRLLQGDANYDKVLSGVTAADVLVKQPRTDGGHP
ncbi:efflux RND transporter periplasmic adaptor subunit [Undibacterium sp. CCC2.1]|nr:MULTISPECIES: HlyD family efflux transporter periplasmic adaptor subunit [unclassified Undibacterium]MEB0140413.1 efflux RND transporter periplasmic adaptor subunit [Undibacterium sp. CCC2.1]MEB0171697.1 efflux RND transporter periplasmic adaptor subunit [Undibacterium sp. CCC1.1]MEB0177418.1 efflux RND transporter periplasmic adaptor subunit [Undibacterium sp. CCC3.4]MEB0215043.1 efflux RND transporter periplasmic adaptor subunit [Undibacterium sp. 5I2]